MLMFCSTRGHWKFNGKNISQNQVGKLYKYANYETLIPLSRHIHDRTLSWLGTGTVCGQKYCHV
jgi:hypothetical protein